MKLLDLTLETPEENLALDEALLDVAEAGHEPKEVLRLWESPQHVVVLGRSSDAETEVNLAACREKSIPVLRRGSGGATVMIGPGCLMYAVVLSYQQRPQLRMIEAAHQFVLDRLRQAIEPQLSQSNTQSQVAQSGISDLTWDTRKFSGNSLKCRRSHFLYHGTIVYDFSLSLMTECLGTPARQPEYRAHRTHLDFVTNIPITPDLLRKDLVRVWQVSSQMESWPTRETARLVGERYSRKIE